jgi:prephenate dehydrogenase
MKIGILGVGHMGSWLARELSQGHEVVVYDKDRDKSSSLAGVTSLRHLSELKHHQPELLINAVSLHHTVQAFVESEHYLTPDCVIADVASIKGDIAAYYRQSNRRFVSVHPMFGPTFAQMERLRQENAVIITESCSEGRELFETLFVRLGLYIFRYSFEEHDRMMAYSLTIPFASSMMFALCVDARTVPGTTFTRHMDIARRLLVEDDHLLAEILFNPYSVAELHRMASGLEFLKHIINARDYEEVKALCDRLRKKIGRTETDGDHNNSIGTGEKA